MSATAPVGIGIIGCGNISAQYLKAAKDFDILDVRGIADLRPEVAEARAAEFGYTAVTIDALLADPKIEIIINLTIPRVHVQVGLQILAAGKHVYGEKPLGINFAEGKKLIEAAEAAGLRVGSAPDTFFGGSHQTCRKIVDSGVLGTPVGGTAFFMRPGHESWHPDPAFYYDIGGGPVLDMAPYYLTDLINLYGPVESVIGIATRSRDERVITSEPRKGEMMDVKVDTHVSGLLRFVNGAVVQMTMSFDVPGHKHVPLELYGTDATLIVPDPNHFGGEISQMKKAGEWETVATTEPYADENYRSIGVADMAYAIRNDRPHRASGALALHALEVMEAFDTSSASGAAVKITTTVERPAPLAESLVDGVLGA